jgi:hypothetical protein
MWRGKPVFRMPVHELRDKGYPGTTHDLIYV